MANGRPKLKIGAYGIQLASRQLLGIIAQEAADRNHDVLFMGGKFRPGADFAEEPFDVMLFSISAGNAVNEPEIELLKRTQSRTAAIFDTPDAINRIEEPELRAKFDLVLVPIPAEVEVAERLGYRNVKFVAVPPHWSRFLRTRQRRDEIRKTLKKTRDIETFHPIAKDDVVVIIGGGKNPHYVNQILTSSIAVCREMFGEKFVLVTRLHPNEVWPKEQEECAKLHEYRRNLFMNIWQVDTARYDTIDQFLLVSDLLIGSGGLTAFLYGAMERLDTIYYEDTGGKNIEIVAAHINKLAWLPIKLGVAEIAIGTNGLVEAIRKLATPEGAQELRRRQRAFASDEFVAAARTFSERAIVDELEKQFLPERIMTALRV